MKNRSKIFARGISEVEFRQVEPISEISFNSFGYCKNVSLTIESDVTNIKDVTGATTLLLKEGEEISIELILLQTSKDEVDLVRDIGNKVYSLRINGAVSNDTAHYLYIENIMFEPNFNLTYSSGERIIQLRGVLVKDTSLSYDVPLYVLSENKNVIDLTNCKFYFNGNLKLNNTTTKVLDVSGFRNHGEVNNQIIWANGTNLQFTGLQDRFAQFPSLSLSDGILFEFWIYMSSRDSIKVVNQFNGNFGFIISSITSTPDEMQIFFGSGTEFNAAIFPTSLAGLSSWNYFGIYFTTPNILSIKINGNIVTPTINVLNGFSNSSSNLIIGKEGLAITENTFSIGKMRIHNALTLTQANTMMANNYLTEKSVYGL